MRFGSFRLGIIILVGFLSVLLLLELMPFIEGGGPPGAASATGVEPPPSLGQQIAALPPWVKVWMHFQDVIVGASLFFLLWRKEAQIYAAGFIANHIFLFALVPMIPPEKLTLGLASLSHWVWIIPLVVLIRAWPQLNKKTGYGTWATVAIAQLIFALIFDIPDGAIFLVSLL